MAGDSGEGLGTFASLPSEEPFPGVTRHSLTGAQATVARYRFRPGASFPLHTHPQEQITIVDEGSVEMTIGGRTVALGAGDFSIVSPSVEHGITAGAAGAAITAIVAPPRGSSDDYDLAPDGG